MKRAVQSIASRLADALLFRRAPANVHQWHRWNSPWPVKLIDGTRQRADLGQLWRRRNGDRWEYQQDAESDEDWWFRQL